MYVHIPGRESRRRAKKTCWSEALEPRHRARPGHCPSGSEQALGTQANYLIARLRGRSACAVPQEETVSNCSDTHFAALTAEQSTTGCIRVATQQLHEIFTE